MASQLEVSVGQYSDKGRKAVNQDFYAAYLPKEPERISKGVALALADGISSSDVGHTASETAVTAFLEDYYCTSEAWSVKKSARRVLMATNAWLHAKTARSQYRYDRDRGYVCTFTAMVIKSTTAHIFHVGDARVYRLRAGTLEQLTQDHRTWISSDKSYLGRALGVDHQVEIDYEAVPVEAGDIFLLVTDGVYDYTRPEEMIQMLGEHEVNLDEAARVIVEAAYRQGSTDNLTVQVGRVDRLPAPEAAEAYQRFSDLPFPPALQAGSTLDGLEVLREIHVSHRSRVYLARDQDSAARVALKIPATDLRHDPILLEKFLTEEWIARRVDSPHIVKAHWQGRRRHYIYAAMEFIDGQTLAQWVRDHPKPRLEQVRDIVEQVGHGLRALHRQEMVHQDIRPDNILIDDTGTVKIIDLGAAKVAGIAEDRSYVGHDDRLGTEQYSAPEYFLGDSGSSLSDIYSLGVVTYQMLTGALPYGPKVARARTKAAQNRLKYASALSYDRAIPVWIDDALRKAVHPNPDRRYAEVSEFLYDLRHPRREFVNAHRAPLIERNPEAFWQGVSLVLGLIIVMLLIFQ